MRLFLQLQNELDQEYQDKFRRLPVEIQEFVQDSAEGEPNQECDSSLSTSSTTEKMNCKAVQSEEEEDEDSTERVFDTPLWASFEDLEMFWSCTGWPTVCK